MKRRLLAVRLLLIAALGVSLGACGHPLIPASALRASTSPIAPPPPSGSSISAPSGPPVLGVDYYANTSYSLAAVQQDAPRNIEYIRHVLDAQSVGIVWNFYSPATTSNSIKRTTITLSPAAVTLITKLAQAQHMSVEYRPLIRVGPQWQWEGFITPADSHAWFAALFKAELPYLRIAQRLHVREFVVGTELRALGADREWPWFIAQVHAVYHGIVSYAAQDTQYFKNPSTLPPFADYGVDPYMPIDLPPTATTAQLVAAWDQVFHRTPASLLSRTAMTEVGIPALRSAYRRPAAWKMHGARDPQVQARWFTAACTVAMQYHMRGVYFYEVPIDDNPAHPEPFAAFFEGNAGSRAIHGCRRMFMGA
jgi:hypothetical protein